MEPKIYVGNLSYDTTESGLSELFGEHGTLVEVKLITDRETGRSKGFAFITFENADQANGALSKDGVELDGRKLRVNIAKSDGGRRR